MDVPDYLGMIEACVQSELGDQPLPELSVTSGEALAADEAWLTERQRVHRVGSAVVTPGPIPLVWGG